MKPASSDLMGKKQSAAQFWGSAVGRIIPRVFHSLIIMEPRRARLWS
ncbi:MAG: hypothetical protein GKR96_01555 [Gammaproteobacteria bacterium]|nr:hypothetical protein [Gammaproteobacteria bacterium]